VFFLLYNARTNGVEKSLSTELINWYCIFKILSAFYDPILF
jgi:hypothetical protein